MPAATVTARTLGSVSFQFTHEADAAHYKIYSSADGPNVDSLMAVAKDNVANPAPIGGLSKFTFSDADLAIANDGEDWWIRIVKVLTSGYEHPVMLSTPGTRIPLVVQGDGGSVMDGDIVLKGAAARISRSTLQTIPTGLVTPTAVILNVVHRASPGMFDPAAPTIVNITETGYYDLFGHASFASGGGKIRKVAIEKNGTVNVAEAVYTPANGGSAVSGGCSQQDLLLQSGDKLKLMVSHDDTGNLDINPVAAASPVLCARRVA